MEGAGIPFPQPARSAMGRTTARGEQRVLIIDDDEAIRQLLVDLLTESGYQTDEARNGREGLERARQRPPDVILLDQLMPGADGTSFAAAYARTPPPRAPIIALCASRDGAEWASSIGAAALVTKPFDIDDLLAAIASVPAAGAGEAST